MSKGICEQFGGKLDTESYIYCARNGILARCILEHPRESMTNGGRQGRLSRFREPETPMARLREVVDSLGRPAALGLHRSEKP